MFHIYLARMIFRAGIFAYAVYLFITQPEKLSISEYFGIKHGFNTVDFIFLVLLIDVGTKFFPHAPIAMGSLKQFKEHHVPTRHTFKGGKDALLEFVRQRWEEGKNAFGIAFEETRSGVIETAKQLFHNIDFLKLLEYDEENLTADQRMQQTIRQERFREILPVIIVWILLNVAIYAVFSFNGWLTQEVILLWTLAYFLSDMICVIAWCPFQVWMMKNRCCTTCQIFNWDAIMATTPLLFLGGVFAWVLVGLAFIVLLRWEIAVARHPERFDERTNASLSCAICKDYLCRMRPPLEKKSKYSPEISRSRQ